MKRSSLFFCILILSKCALGQPKSDLIVIGDSTKFKDKLFTLTGTIINSSTNKPIQGAHIHADGLIKGLTDDNGRYLINLDRGYSKLAVRHISMVPKFYRVTIYDNGVLNIELAEKTFELDEVIIKSQADDANVKQILSGTTIVDVAELKAIPALAGEPDVIKSLQFLPGVTSVGEGSAGVNIRGGRTDQNLMLVNDAILLSPNHAIGFLSPYNADAVDNFTLYKGSIPSYYGGRSASTLNVQMRNGNFSNWNYQVSPGISISKLLIEGPIVKDKVSLLIGGRISNTNWLLKEVKDDRVSSSSINFNDSYSSIAIKLNSRNLLNINLLTTGDNFNFSNQFGYNWSTLLASANLKNLISKNGSLVTLMAYGKLTNENFSTIGDQSISISNGIQYGQFKSSYLLTSNNHSITMGGEAVYYLSSPEKIKPNNPSTSIIAREVSKSKGLELSLFLSDDWSPKEWISFSAGVRYSQFLQMAPDTIFKYALTKPRTIENITDTLAFNNGVIKRFSGIEPRFSTRISLSENKSIKLGYSKLYQYLHSISNTTVPSPIDLWQVSTEHIKPQESDNYSIGYFQNFKKNLWSFSMELFYRESENQLEYKDFASLYLNNHIETELISSKGRSYGMELQVKKNIGKWSGWLSYTFSRSFSKANGIFADEKINRGEWFPSNHDKPHVASLILNRKFWPSGSFNFTATYSTGRPISVIDSYYSANGTVIPNYSARNQFRIPDYFRIDIAFTIGNIIKKYDDSLTIGVYNLFGFHNAYSVYYQRFANQPELAAYKLSLIGSPLPSINYTITFK